MRGQDNTEWAAGNAAWTDAYPVLGSMAAIGEWAPDETGAPQTWRVGGRRKGNKERAGTSWGSSECAAPGERSQQWRWGGHAPLMTAGPAP